MEICRKIKRNEKNTWYQEITTGNIANVWVHYWYTTGTLLDTETDIQRRKGLTINTINTLQNLFHSHKLTIKTKVRIFEAYVSSVFLYNSELWVLDKNLGNKIDSFHRRMLRTVLKIKWPIIMKNEEVYHITNVVKWSETIRK